MPIMETVTIINKSGKVVSTGKHLANIFKDAKSAYNEKKAEKKAEHQKRIEYKAAQKLIQAREETQSVASSRRSRRSHSSRHHKDRALTTRPPRTHRNLSHIEEGSVASSRRSRSSEPRARQSISHRDHADYRAPYLEDTDQYAPNPGIIRRHSDFSVHGGNQMAERAPPPYRSVSNPDFHDNIDMNLAYGELHHPPRSPVEEDRELQATMSKLDALLLEAHCLQHSATAIISNLQSNPEAMAAVALTLAELSNILKKMSPAILAGLKTSSPAIFALLASPQFLIAGGLALGVTVVMFGGYKIVKQIQASNDAKREANRMEEAMVYDNFEMGSIESWRRGIAEVEVQSVGTSVDGEFITPEAARQKKERIRERAREERHRHSGAESVVSERSHRSHRSVRRRGSEGTIQATEVSVKSTSKARPAPSESGKTSRSERKRKESKGKEVQVVTKEKKKKSSALSLLFKKHKDQVKDSESSGHSRSHRPKMIEI
ncbi:uncharacterized protein BP5553_04578 [Venustampulla echinocandica]|uniref:Uncharacterized protein n=1 Tax=Venustampulla echinocandica TaxID=2656787 RepID=A0A370TNP1_9HELO|nr:uncharacterized protein BP5553_04578 [Venustampulla echinocandica]RDL37145.1 hypothetical protein BP5553_04578 [Venustampulla echinocandica]